MATRLEEDQQLKRIVKVRDIGDVEVTLSTEGLAFRIPGTRIGTTLNLTQAILKSQTPSNVKSYFMGKPFEFLQSQTKLAEERQAKKAAKEKDTDESTPTTN